MLELTCELHPIHNRHTQIRKNNINNAISAIDDPKRFRTISSLQHVITLPLKNFRKDAPYVFVVLNNENRVCNVRLGHDAPEFDVI